MNFTLNLESSNQQKKFRDYRDPLVGLGARLIASGEQLDLHIPETTALHCQQVHAVFSQDEDGNTLTTELSQEQLARYNTEEVTTYYKLLCGKHNITVATLHRDPTTSPGASATYDLFNVDRAYLKEYIISGSRAHEVEEDYAALQKQHRDRRHRHTRHRPTSAQQIAEFYRSPHRQSNTSARPASEETDAHDQPASGCCTIS